MSFCQKYMLLKPAQAVKHDQTRQHFDISHLSERIFVQNYLLNI